MPLLLLKSYAAVKSAEVNESFIIWHWNTLVMQNFSHNSISCNIMEDPCYVLKKENTTNAVNFQHFIVILPYQWLNTLRPRQNGRHFADDIFKCIFLNENVWLSVKISWNFVPQGPINTIPALVQIMACRRPGDKPLSEPMMVSLLTHICVTRPQWLKERGRCFSLVASVAITKWSLTSQLHSLIWLRHD